LQNLTLIVLIVT